MNNINKIEKKDLFKQSLFIGIALLIILMLSNVFTLVIQALLMSFGYSLNESLNVFFDTWSGYLINTVLAAVVYTFPFLIMKVVNKKPFYEICSFNTPANKFAPFCIGLVMGTAMVANIITTFLNSFLSNFLGFEAVQQSIGDNVYSDSNELIYTIVAAAVLPALVEEFAFRGVILGSLRKFGDMPAIVFSATIFALFHGNFVQIPFAFLVGIALGLTVVITNSIWPAIIAHFLNNSYAVIVNAVQEKDVLLVSALFILIILLGIVSLIYLCKRKAFRNIKKQPSTMSSTSKFFRMFLSPTVLAFVVLMIFTAYKSRA